MVGFAMLSPLSTIIAPDYSDLRFLTIDGNAIAVLVAMIMTVVGKQMRWQLLSAGGLLVSLWSYVAAVSSVV